MVTARPHQALKPGSVIADKYRVEKELGRGGFGLVVRAVHLTLGQTVAIKVLTPNEAGDAAWHEDAARFRREAQATAALRGEHIVRILDVDALDDGSPYLVMEHLEGETLHRRIHRGGPLAIAEAVDDALQILAALAEAHAAGIVHRDLKPANVFLARGHGGAPVVKVLDFGVSKTNAGLGSMQVVTKTGAIVGTVAYMAPEQLLDAKRVDARADLWAVGMILYESLAARLPFGQGNAPTLVSAMLTKTPAALSVARPDLPPRLDAIVMKALAREPETRWASAAAMGEALAPFASPRARSALDALRRAAPPSGAAARAKPRPKPSKRERPSHLWILGAAVVASMALLGMAAGVFLAGPRPAQPRIATADAGAIAVSGGETPEATVTVGGVVRAEAGAAGVARPAPAPPSAGASAPSANDCDPPFVFDESGIKRYKPDCLD
ncbi:MAG: protein kinase [Labilithrix sp.]|nr:protein kinase [Labilithrix sp.]